MCGCIDLFIKKKQNDKHFYRFYTDRLEYYNTFFTKNIKQVKYEEFVEIKYNQGYIQSKFKLGEIWILTNNKNFFKKALMFKLIPDVEENYERIVKLFNT